ncbi:hypothetical protein G7Y89_g11835 [Cudoniella acicularis]|uniref:Transcription factor domain-containing protein n=1 Tax=Cudoniella acicularis TaxID=354080 RepID=A0A8H4VZT2_9HELO|nr:hypothetical protein G7Y89_g11835 [Cudoniella acicularis]
MQESEEEMRQGPSIVLPLHQVSKDKIHIAILTVALLILHLYFSKALSCRYLEPPRKVHPKRLHPTSQSATSSLSPSHCCSSTPAESASPLNNFPAVFYLDWKVFQQCQVEIPKPTTPLHPNIFNCIGNPENWEVIASSYFSAAHTWMPIISKKRFYEYIQTSSGQIRSDYSLLIMCMDLICWLPIDQNPRTPAYLAAKSFYLNLEIQGVVSLQVLQAGILIALFELGHAIFPSAAISIDACIGRPDVPLALISSSLGSVSRIGYPRRPLLTDDPSPKAVLPADDSAWDEGVMPPNYFSGLQLHNPEALGRFALTAEATRLLGQVMRHVEEASRFDDPLHDEEALLLDRTLQALATVVEFEGQTHNLDVMNQTLLYSIALTILHEAHASRKGGMSGYFDRTHHAKVLTDILSKAGKEASEQGPQSPIQECMRDASPFMTTLLYHIATANLRICQDLRTDESEEALAVTKAAMNEFDRRWKSSGAYLKILEAREVSLEEVGAVVLAGVGVLKEWVVFTSGGTTVSEAVADEDEEALADEDVVEAGTDVELVDAGEADDELMVVDPEELEVVGPAEADAAVAAQEQTASAALWTCSALVIPQAEITQDWAALWIAADWELLHWQA